MRIRILVLQGMQRTNSMFAKQENGIQHSAGVTKAGSSVTIQSQLDPPLSCRRVELGRVESSRVESVQYT